MTIANDKGWLNTKAINKTDNEIAPKGEIVTRDPTSPVHTNSYS